MKGKIKPFMSKKRRKLKELTNEKHLLQEISGKVKAIGHPIRLEIIELLEKNVKLSVLEIQKSINHGQSQTSQHLRILKNIQILTTESEGTKRFYLLKQKKIAEILSGIDESIQQNQAELEQLKEVKKGLMQDLLTGKVRVKV